MVRFRSIAAASALLLVLGVSAAVEAPAAFAALPPATVTQDALPTVQVNGVVWDQVTVGTTVYAVGDFTSARPAGAPAGTDETPRTDILAYDITTGDLITSFDHTLNGEVKTIAASPDGSRIYIGGSFTSVDGQDRYRIAAFDTATGDLVSSFDPAADAGVSAVAATNSTVYFGGNFGMVDGNDRSHLAAVTSDGALTGWAPSTDNPVNALLLTPDASKVIAAGSFDEMDGAAAHGIAALDPTNGAVLPWGMSSVTKNGASSQSGFLTLATDGTYVYAGAWQWSTGTFEGTAALNPSTGNPVWINDCWGDTYSVYAHAGVLYTAGHAHDCSWAGWFPQTDPRTWHYALAYGTAPSANHNIRDSRGWNYSAYHTSSLLQWNPQFTPGTFTGLDQAAWSVSGTGDYVAYGGEFTAVNGTAQQGLVRFTTHANAPNAFGPRALGTITARASATRVMVTTSQRAYDPDDGYLTYQLIRNNNTAAPVVTARALTPGFWQPQPPLTITDTSVAPGTTYSYRLRVFDAGGKSTGTNTVTVTTPAK